MGGPSAYPFLTQQLPPASAAPKLVHGFRSADENRIPLRPMRPYFTSKCEYSHTLILACERETGARRLCVRALAPSRWTRRSFTNGARSRSSTRAPAEVVSVDGVER